MTGDKCKTCGTEYVYEDLTLGGITARYPRCPNCEPWPDECPKCREILEGNFDDTGLICPECDYEFKFKDTEQEKN